MLSILDKMRKREQEFLATYKPTPEQQKLSDALEAMMRQNIHSHQQRQRLLAEPENKDD